MSNEENKLIKPPSNIDAEKALLGTTLSRPAIFDVISNTLKPEDFYEEKNRTIWIALNSLRLEKPDVTIDIVTLVNHLTEKGLLEKAGGTGYIAELTNTIITGNITAYTDLIKDSASRRKTWEIGQQLCEKAINATEPLYNTLAEVANSIDTISKARSGQRYYISSEQADFEKFINSVSNKQAIDTGFKKLNSILGANGLTEGLIVFGAPSSAGKTTFFLQMMNNIAKQGIDCLYFAFEQSANELRAKMLSYEVAKATMTKGYDIDTFGNVLTDTEIKRGQARVQGEYTDFNNTQRASLQTAIEVYKSKLAPHIKFIEPRTGLTAQEIRHIAEQHRRTTGKAPFIFVDYLQLITPPESRSKLIDKEVTDRNITILRQLARDLKTTVLAISSLPRSVYTKRLDLSAYKESGSIEYSADICLTLQYKIAHIAKPDNTGNEQKIVQQIDDAKNKTVREMVLSVLKDRNGRGAGTVDLNFHPHCNTFIECI